MEEKQVWCVTYDGCNVQTGIEVARVGEQAVVKHAEYLTIWPASDVFASQAEANAKAQAKIMADVAKRLQYANSLTIVPK